jgi:hypothetical protein
MTLQEAARMLRVLASVWPAYPIADPDTMAEAYAIALADVPAELAMGAAQQALRTSRFFPTPSEVRELVAEEVLDLPTPEEAWEEVLAEIRAVGRYGRPRFTSDVLAETVARLGWLSLCGAEDVAAARATFERSYKAHRRRWLRDVDFGDALAGAAAIAGAEVPAVESGREGR